MKETFGYFLKYAGLLDEGELLDVFDLVRSAAGSISEAARRCGIERKTIYDLMNEGKQIKQETRERILRAALTANLEKSIGILLSKAMRESKDIFVSYLSLIYQSAMRAGNSATFNEIASRFESLLSLYPGLVVHGLQEEVSSMISGLVNKGEKLGTGYIPPGFKAVDSATLGVLIPALVKDLLTMRAMDQRTLAYKWRIDPSIIQALSQVLSQSVVEFDYPYRNQPVARTVDLRKSAPMPSWLPTGTREISEVRVNLEV